MGGSPQNMDPTKNTARAMTHWICASFLPLAGASGAPASSLNAATIWSTSRKATASPTAATEIRSSAQEPATESDSSTRNKRRAFTTTANAESPARNRKVLLLMLVSERQLQ